MFYKHVYNHSFEDFHLQISWLCFFTLIYLKYMLYFKLENIVIAWVLKYVIKVFLTHEVVIFEGDGMLKDREPYY